MKKLICRLSVCAGLFLSAAGAFGASTYYVATTGDDGAAGTADAPWATVTHAVATASAGDIIHVGEGTWTWSGKVEKGFTLEGEGDATILKTTAAVAFNAADLVIKNCQLGKNAGANYCSYTLTSGTISNCWFTGCKPLTSTVNTTLSASGGLVTDCRFTQNTSGNGTSGSATYFGAAVSASGNATFRRCLFAENTVGAGAGACDEYGCAALNATPASGKTVTLEDCSIVGNAGGSSGGLVIGTGYSALAGSVVLRNCVLGGNTTRFNYRELGNTATHSKDITWFLGKTGSITVENCVLGTAPDNLMTDATVSGTTVGPIGFVDEIAKDFTPVAGSAAFGRGAFDQDRGTDFACAVKVPAVDRAIGSLAVTLEALTFNAPAGEAAYAWDLDGDGVYETTDRGASFGYAFETPGWHKVGLKVTIGGETAEQPAANLVYVAPTKIYLAKSGKGVFPYDTEENAAKTLAAAQTAALEGSEIDVRGVFTTGFGSIVLNDVTLTGHGWATSEIIVSVATYYGGVTVRDLSIKSPGGNNTKGFNIVRDSVTLSNCWIHGYQHSDGSTPGGSATAGTFVGCRFTDSRNNGGSGIYSFGGTAKVRNSVFTGNYFNANSKDHYGIVYLSGNVQFENNVVYGNYAVAVTAGKASKSAGIYVSGGQPTVRNCVVRGNKKDGTLATGTEANWCFAAGLTPTVEYCNTPDLPDAGPTIQTAIPKFVDPDNTTVANRDFRLQADSPCIDAGLYQVWQKTAVDAAGAARFQGYRPDIGAYEFAKDTPALGIAADKSKYYGAQDVTLTASSTNGAAMASGTTYLWTVDGVEQDETSGTLAKYLETGTYRVTATSRQCDYFTAAFELVVHEIPGVDFDSEEVAGVGRKTVTFTPRGTGGLTIDDAATYAWYVNDETGAGEPVSTERTPTLEFNEPGTYGVLLKVANADDEGATYEKYRPEGAVVETPGVDIALSETTGEGRTLVTLTATPTGFVPDEAARYEWRWTDLQSAAPELTGNPATGTFRAGTWSVQVVVANADGAGLAVTNVIADAVTIAPGADFYVAATGDNANPGTKKSPYKTLAAALDAATAGQKIKISGLLTDSFQRTVSGVEIYGDGPAESGLWSSDQSCYLKLTDGAFIHGIRIGQSREQGGILRMADDSCVVSNCWVAGNWFTTGGSPAGDISAGLVTHTLFSGNHCNYGPVVSVGGTAKVRNCVFTGNTIDNGADTKQTFKGVVVLGSTAVFENNTVYGNTAALCSDNVARQVCAGVYVSSGTPTVRNNIIWNNRINGSLATGTVGNYYCKAGEPVLANNCTEEGVGENPVTGDPGFTALDMTKPAEQRDFSITTASPCCDKGAPAEWLAGATDYAGNPRVMGWGVDLGAYEAVAKILEFGIEPAASVVTGAQAVAVAVTGDTAAVPADAVVRWFVDGEEAEPQGLSVNLPLEEGHHDIAVDLGGFFRVERKDCIWVKTPEAVDFTTDEVPGDGKKTVTFTAIARGLEFDPAAEFAWYWKATGEGDPDATGNPAVHTFGPGTYDVFVRVTNADGKGGTLTTNRVAAVVVEPMTASIRLSSTIGETSKSVALTAVASGFTINSAATCTWTWTRTEDGATGTLTGNPAINVYTTGTYSFALRIANADGEGAVVEASLAEALRVYAAQSVEIPSGQGTTPVYLDQLGKIPFKTINGQPIAGQGELTVTSADSYRAVEDVADYGAVGDGRTDDTAAIMAAIKAAYASGKPLYFPKNGKGATYLTRKGLILRDGLTVTSDPGVTLANASAVLDGAGQTLHINLAASVAKGATSCTVVSAAGLVVGQEITLLNASADSYAETLADVERIEGNTVYFNTSRFTESGENEGAIGAYSATGMVLTDISLVKSVPGLTAVNCTVENLTLRPYGNAADPYVYTLSPLHQTKQGFRSNNTLRVRNVTIEGSKHDGISAQGSGDIWIENCVVRDVKHKGIHWGTTCDRITIRGNLCLRCGSAAAEKVSNNGGTGGMYFCYNNHRVLIEGNRMVDCYRGVFGFDERDASGGVDTDSLIANNVFENCTLSGVSPDGFYGTGRHLRIAGNQFIRFTGAATPILFTHNGGLSGSVISGNVFGDFQDGYAGENGAIMIENANGVVIRGNVIERNPSATGSTDVRIANSRRIALSGNVVDGAIDDTDAGNTNILKTDNVEIKEVK